MGIYNKDSRLSSIFMAHPTLIPVAYRLGVNLGVGDVSVAEICSTHGLDCNFFLLVINTFIDEEYFPSRPFDSFSLEKTIDYLEKTSEYYRKVQLPNIERHFRFLLDISGKENNLDLLSKFFTDMKDQFTETLTYEMDHLFPLLRKGETPPHDYDILNGHNEIEERLHDLLTFLVMHLHGNYDSNLCMAVVLPVFNLRKDVNQNNRIRSRILMPQVEALNIK